MKAMKSREVSSQYVFIHITTAVDLELEFCIRCKIHLSIHIYILKEILELHVKHYV